MNLKIGSEVEVMRGAVWCNAVVIAHHNEQPILAVSNEHDDSYPPVIYFAVTSDVGIRSLESERTKLINQAEEIVQPYHNTTADSARLYTIGKLVDHGWRPTEQGGE